MSAMLELRLATHADVPGLCGLIEESVRGLGASHYSPAQLESALRFVFGPDTQLIADRTYYVMVGAAGELAAGGGWSRRKSLYGGDQMKTEADPQLDPVRDAARIRAFFVHPAWSRRGLARRLFDRCAAEATRAGFRRLELAATLPGEPLYRELGFTEVERFDNTLPDGERITMVRMTRPL